MNRKYIAVLIIFIILFVVDYFSFGMSEVEMEQQTQEFILSWDIGVDAALITSTVTDKMGARYYLGGFKNGNNNGSFIIGYRKHWFSNRFKDPFFLIDRTGRRIIPPGVPIESGYIKYLAYLEEGSDVLVVKTVLNTTYLWYFIGFIGAFFLGKLFSEGRRR